MVGSVDNINEMLDYLHESSVLKSQPVNRIRWISMDRIVANDYNPNAVAAQEMKLLYVSIASDGYTQPIVAVYDCDTQKYVIVDGFHRYSVMREHPDIYASTGGLLPIVVLDKGMNDRMASTVRHNRARGKHSVAGMANMVFKMLKDGWTDANICNKLGMEIDELVRLKHVTGFSRLFSTVEYRRAWDSENQNKQKTKHEHHP